MARTTPSESELRRRELEAARASARALQAADDVRREIGRHLHDRVQTLAIAARQQLYLGRTDEADRLLDELTRELQDVARGLHVTGLEAGLRPALEALVQRSPVRLVVEELPDVPLGAAIEATIHALVAEAVNNAAKHARASRVRVHVRADGRTLIAEVADDGAGGADAHGGSGLLGVRDRVTLLGGELHVDSPPGGGTTLRATLPVSPERLGHRQFFLVGHDEDESAAEQAVEGLLGGRKTHGLSLVREWEAEGGAPELGQLMPVIDGRGRRRLTVEVVGLELYALRELDIAMFRRCGIDGETLADCRAAVRAHFDACRPALAVVLEDPAWRFGEDEPMLVIRHRVVDEA